MTDTYDQGRWDTGKIFPWQKHPADAPANSKFYAIESEPVSFRSSDPEPVRVKIQNVHKYVLDHGLEHGWDDLQNFFCCRLPFPYICFSEISMHRQDFALLVREIPGDAPIDGIGIPVKSNDVNDPSSRLRKFQDEVKPFVFIKVDIVHLNDQERQIPHQGTLSTDLIPIDESGQVLTDANGVAYLRFLTQSRAHLMRPEIKNAMDLMLTTVLAAINFMNCRNVEFVDNPPTRQQRRHAEQRGEKPPVTYKTLTLRPFGRRNRRQQRAQAGSDRVTALHIVRGHFKDYRVGSGLGRGRAHGLWWWSPQVRGTDPTRAVVKDYQVETA